MVLDWVKSEAVRKAAGYLTDPRPAWLWSAQGDQLIWSNPAAKLFRAKSKRQGLKLSPPAIPIKGQVARLIRMGSPGRASLSRMQFLAGKKPVSATCTCTPLRLEDGTMSLLIVGVDPIEKDVFADQALAPEMIEGLFGETNFVIRNEAGDVLGASPADLTTVPEDREVVELPAGPGSTRVAVFEATGMAGEPEPVTGPEDEEAVAASIALTEVPVEDAGVNSGEEAAELPQEPDTQIEPQAEGEDESEAGEKLQSLTRLFDRLADDSALFTPLGPQDDEIPPGITPPDVARKEWPDEAAVAAGDETASPADTTGFIADAAQESPDADDTAADEAEAEPVMWRITGRGFRRVEAETEETIPAGGAEEATPADTDAADEEVSSRYNFEELSRILTDRVNTERSQADRTGKTDVTALGETPARKPARPTQSGELVSLGDETLVLNRLPIGLMIFRDQNILFANRALTDLIGYPDSASLRADGIGAIFPESGDSGVGPVTHLAHKDGSQVPVSARLQSVTWQGKPAFMLSAKKQDMHLSTEAAVRSFAEGFATLNGCGFFETSRAGIIDSVSGRAAELFGRSPEVLIGRPLILMAGHEDAVKLREFLEKPAQFAETARPGLMIDGIDPGMKIMLFAEGQAGIITGYFGIVQQADHPRDGSEAVRHTADGVEPAVLKRFSRGMRRPLNTIIGFAELIRGNAFGPIDNQRYMEYARDIKLAGQEILNVIDELEEFVSLHTGEYQASAVDFDLGLLLDKCIARVRRQAGEARVLVRSAISERLPHIRADETSLGQAILNLLASAIDQTPEGGQVVLSAQREQDGSVAIHVKDSGGSAADLAERFVVFRDGTHQNGDLRKPVASTVGLALTRSLLAVNTCSLSIDPASGSGTLLSLMIPAELAADRA